MQDIAIIGGGPAGLTAGLYAARGGASVTLYEELFVGGAIAKTPVVENFPGFPEGLEGYAIGALLQRQAEKFGLNVTYTDIAALDLAGSEKRFLAGGDWHTAKAVILCMGASPRKLGLAREDALTGAGVSYCATCDGALFREANVAVVGGGDTALSDALYLSRFCSSVTVVHRRDELRASAALQQAAFADDHIHFAYSCVPLTLVGETKLEGLELRDLKSEETRVLPVNGVFVAIGVEPRTALVGSQVALAGDGGIITDEAMRTSLPGVFAAGDVRSTPLRQVVTACADGALAATSALSYLTSH